MQARSSQKKALTNRAQLQRMSDLERNQAYLDFLEKDKSKLNSVLFQNG